tara:strand:+ start:19892 stop:20080 length:189 start_codon:yes stop_codon:yes gene_type:complete
MDGIDLDIKKKDSTLLIKVNKEEKKKFIALCELNDSSASREIRRFMKEYINNFSVEIKLDND